MEVEILLPQDVITTFSF